MIAIAGESVPQVWKGLPLRRRPTQWDPIEEPVGALEGNLYGHLLAGLLWERNIEEVLRQQHCEMYHKRNVFISTTSEFFRSVYVDDIKVVGNTYFGTMTPSVNQTYFGCTER